MDDDWGLQAVVRGCSATLSTTSATATTLSSSSLDLYSFSKLQEDQEGKQHHLLYTQKQEEDNFNLLCFQSPFEPRNNEVIEELCDLYKPFFTNNNNPSPQKPPNNDKPFASSSSSYSAFQDLSSPSPPSSSTSSSSQVLFIKPNHLPITTFSTTTTSSSSSSSSSSNANNNTHAQTPRSKRRKNQMKRVCQVPAEGLSSDMWSWRKYGQKPIKGSPYPRGYYRCSTSKGCLARKQVERNRSDPNMFIVTYTAEHNHPMPTHRNSLAGSTRQKPTNSGEPNKSTTSPPASPAASLSPATEKLESSKEGLIREEDEDDEFGISDIPLDDDFFAGLDVDLVGPGPALFSDHLSSNGQFPWLGNSAATTAAGGG